MAYKPKKKPAKRKPLPKVAPIDLGPPRLTIAPPTPYKTVMGGSFKSRRNRRQTRGRFKLHKPEWVDPFPWIAGTEPEKRVFAALVAKNIFFIYQGQVPEYEKGGKFWFARPVNFKPDFILPEYKLIIDPFSPFHHSLPEAIKRDESKIAVYAAAGYAYYHPWAIGPGVWSWSQRHNLVNPKQNNRYGKIKRAITTGQVMGTQDMLASIPELNVGPKYPLTAEQKKLKQNPGYYIGENLGAGATSQAIVNANRAKPPLLSLKVGTRRNKRTAGTKR